MLTWTHFKLVVRDDITVVQLVGRTMDDSEKLQELGTDLNELVDRRGHRRIILDMSSIQFLNSSALGILVTLRQKVRYNKGELVLCGLRNQLQQVFRFSQLHQLFTFCDTADQALAAMGGACSSTASVQRGRSAASAGASVEP